MKSIFTVLLALAASRAWASQLVCKSSDGGRLEASVKETDNHVSITKVAVRLSDATIRNYPRADAHYLALTGRFVANVILTDSITKSVIIKFNGTSVIGLNATNVAQPGTCVLDR